ncbi:tRNA uridine-5-carboxymethylaminomethyl(34) synthesis GTPase MnmE [Rhizobium sp. S152]|uniref:tRNA uridine-5-carboxymethylaminomethyl(34) synthesis GTPase MnmE n=1 Tax=Rhizobium sp. S152 TaxID=3055038 RepID=UPI0025A9714A|nr:tRNA uridine-5-carboxymethylaminomethyl(34) synthesis GTPase MnmE [Rhizobium sp. S152]MDM9624487.1 tRNA uridine-5-carboxymethylaminomethyl(34) synthesis GTPase MnmE [Rhizobium sp. S152]
MTPTSETIYALSSGTLPAGVAVVRLSGSGVGLALKQLIGDDALSPRHAALKTIRTRNGEVLDKGLILFFPGPGSFTGEDVAELHLHGGRAVVEALYRELAGIPDFRRAEPGEFSRRAFENGKLDLVEIEGLADLIAAETEMQRRLAVEQSTGGLSGLYDGWAKRLTRARALIEAELDFADEDDVPGSVSDQVWADMAVLRQEIYKHLAEAEMGEIIRDGFKVVIAGEPNAGKSTLMNALVKREVAIVTDIAGTTRDVLQANISIDGCLVKLFDTAGLRETLEPVEREGIRRAQLAIEDADLVLFVEDISLPAPMTDLIVDNAIVIGTKADLPRCSRRQYDLLVSAEESTGLDRLRAIIGDRLKDKVHPHSMAIASRERHKDSLSKCLSAVEAALEDELVGLDVRAEELRAASDALGRVTGRVDVENLLDVIFGEFCIGK